MHRKKDRQAGFRHALITLGIMVVVIFVSIVIMGTDPQIPLLVGCIVAGLVSFYLGFQWEELIDGIVHSIGNAIEAILILLIIGTMVGTWIACGTIPTIIYYGLSIMGPHIFLPATVLLSTLVALATGSWGCVGTIGISFIGIGGALGIPLPLVAGAIVSGAYAGEMLSPISDASNLSAAISGGKVFAIVRDKMFIALVSLLLAVGAYAVMGQRYAGHDAEALRRSIDELMGQMASQFQISVWALLPMVVVVVCILLKWPAIPAMLSGSAVAIVEAVLLQKSSLLDLFTVSYYGYVSESGNESLDELLTAGGMESMFYCITIILIAMAFGGIMQKTGQMQAFVSPIVSRIKSNGGLLSLTVVTGFLMNGILPDQYLGISLPGQMYKEEYAKRGIPERVLGSTILAGSRTSPIIPWNTCGIYCMTVLGVDPVHYAPFAFFCILTPLLTIAVAMLHRNKSYEA